MEENSVGSGSGGNAMDIFGQSIDVRRPSKSRRRVVSHKNLSPEIEESIGSSRRKLHRRKAIAEDQEQARVESELSRAMNMAMELERQIEQTNAKARSRRSELQRQRTRASGGGSRRKTARGLAAEAAGGAPAHRQEGVGTAYGEVMQELDRVKGELRKLQREVMAAMAAKGTAGRRDAEAEASTSSAVSSGPRGGGGVERDADGASEEHGVLVELAVGTAATARIRRGILAQRAGGEPSLQAAEAELSSARIELESIKAEGLRFTASIERTRRETARVTDEIRRLTEQEKAASAHVQQLNAKLLKARSRLEAVTAADERADETISKLAAILRQLEDDAAAAEKEKTLADTENRRAMSDAENIDAEIAAAEKRIRESVRELGAARASEGRGDGEAEGDRRERDAGHRRGRDAAELVVRERHDPQVRVRVPDGARRGGPRGGGDEGGGGGGVGGSAASQRERDRNAGRGDRKGARRSESRRCRSDEHDKEDAILVGGDVENGKVTEDAILVGGGGGAEAEVAVVQR
ncbi:hypothetical protein OsJ_19452 [Oryza sativa Japonica Group]|uniref:Uncharacterized protein n=1 Tax=Oryza sativa subsp. japonica TaxID=39947 RepID=B9FLH2_ORYSJ|nr:hypothetical protein OsJ_19452 [Oryza sativa Japonica Group]